MIGKILVDVLLIVSGIYFFYAAIYLKKGFPEKVLSLPKEANAPSKEKIGLFVKKMFPITLCVGVWGIGTGIVQIIDQMSGIMKEIPYYLVLSYLILIVTYGFLSTHARNRYLL